MNIISGLVALNFTVDGPMTPENVLNFQGSPWCRHEVVGRVGTWYTAAPEQ